MLAYLVRRLLGMIPQLFILLLMVVVMVRLVPGDTVDALIGDQGTLPPDVRQQLERSLGINEPVHIQYFNYLRGVLQGDLGTSVFRHRPVTDLIVERLPVTFELAAGALLVSLAFSIPAGVFAALNRGKILDHVFRFIAVLLLAIPGFVVATYLIVLPAKYFQWRVPLYVPLTDDPLQFAKSMAIPVLATATAFMAGQMRVLRSSMLEVLNQDYIRTARAKGLGSRVILFGHALKNALIPSVTLIGLETASLLGGAVIIEQIFSLPGVGQLLFSAFTQRDYPVIQGITLFLGIIVVTVNVMVDVVYAFLDPRIKVGQ